MSDILQYLRSFSVRRSVQNAEASGTIVLSNKDGIYASDWSGDVAIDKKIQALAGYSSPDDPVKSACLTGLIAGVDEGQEAKTAKEEISVKVLSSFKNYIKQKITTDWYENKTGQYICNSIVDDFMDWASRDFSACAGTTFRKIRFEDKSPKQIIMEVCEACSCDLIIKADGTIFAVAFPNFNAAADWSYAKTQISKLSSAEEIDISTVNTEEMKGKMFAPDEIREVKVAEETFSWYNLVSPYEWYNPYVHLVIHFDKTPVWQARFETSVVGYPETISFQILEVEENQMTILCHRSGTLPYPDIDFTVTCYGRPYQDAELNQLQLTVKNFTLFALYDNIEMKQKYENKIIQTEAALQNVGEYKLKQNLYRLNRKTFKASHNPSLELNDLISAETPTATLKCLVRTIRIISGVKASELYDILETWVVAATKTITTYKTVDDELVPDATEEVEVPAGIPEVDSGLPDTNRIFVTDNDGKYVETEDEKLVYIEGT